MEWKVKYYLENVGDKLLRLLYFLFIFMQISLFQEHLCDVQPILPNSHMLSPPGGADLQKQGGDCIVKQIHILSIDNCVCQALNQLYIFKFAYKLKKCMSY